MPTIRYFGPIRNDSTFVRAYYFLKVPACRREWVCVRVLKQQRLHACCSTMDRHSTAHLLHSSAQRRQ